MATTQLVVVAAAGLCLLLTGCTVAATGRPAAAPDLGRWQPPPILTPRLGDLLLSAGDVNSVGHTRGMTLRTPIAKMGHAEDLVSNPSCLDAYSPIQAAAYQGSNWTAVQGQILDDAASPADPIKHALVQALVAFRDADSAQQYFGQAKPRWSACANRPLTVNRPGRSPVRWTFGDLAATDSTLSILQTEEGGGGFACHRAMGLANNVIIDALWCGTDTSNQAGQVVGKIAAAISQA
ncbi:sensor domain-containing protein [Mycobacterium sp. 1081908.1]|uniref:sensor domain-containing protein n=1 Tax=Mycobacterium sp. 1081908.1 TaxID=1834066 RepID=UPI000800FEE1|nr:sensor domain-containing protein [Mycobacterium sp. 1081908.1]OBK46775.1 hypothetical protein A5655_08730 [Mycobacterium sp. 1081908.1]